jgi:hypothetical protein
VLYCISKEKKWNSTVHIRNLKTEATEGCSRGTLSAEG